MSNIKLSVQKKLFAQEYIVDLNGTLAAERAGYSKRSATATASRLLRIDNIKLYIQELMKEREERTKITADMVIQELAKVAMSDIRDLYDKERLLLPYELSDNASASISSFKTKREGNSDEGFYEIEEYKRFDKIRSLEILCRHFGLFNEKEDKEISLPVLNITIKEK